MGNSISLEETDENEERGHENNIEMKITSSSSSDTNESRESRENSNSNRGDIKKSKKTLNDVSKKRRSTSKNGNANTLKKTKSVRRR